MEQLSQQEIQTATLEMMDYIHQICEENNIVYYLSYGTLIGAIRHNGFIPWDDDFDIQMTRKEYERFRLAFMEKNHAYYRICDRKNTENYFYGIPRFSDSRYHYTTTHPGIKPFDTGLFIDIYILDDFGNTKEEAERIKKKVIRKNMMYDVYMNKEDGQGKAAPFIRKICHYLLRAWHGSGYPNRIDDEIRNFILKRTSPTDRQTGEVCWDPQIVPYRKEWFAERVLHEFNGRQYWIPKEYDTLLRFEYGDYMQLPPPDRRVAQHECIITKA